MINHAAGRIVVELYGLTTRLKLDTLCNGRFGKRDKITSRLSMNLPTRTSRKGSIVVFRKSDNLAAQSERENSDASA